MFYNTKNKKAFTLVELIIVVTIIAILATVAFISFGDYPSQTRDAVRRTDLGNIKKGLELYKIENGDYPLPNNCVEYVDPRSTEEQENTVGCEEKEVEEGKMVGYRYGEIGEDLKEKLKFGGKLEDPLGKKYKYNLSKDGKYYSVEIELETGEKIQEGNISKSCEEIKRNNQFKGSGEYKIYSENFRPIDVFCHENYNETFYSEIINGDMERTDIKTFESFSGNSIVYSEEENSTPGGKVSIKAEGIVSDWGYLSKNFTYINPNKKYVLSAKVKVRTPNGRGTPSHIGFISYTKGMRHIDSHNVNYLIPETTELLEDSKRTDDKIYFKCFDENGFDYRKLESKIYRTTNIAYEAKDDLSDLPNFNVNSKSISDNNTGLLTGYLQKENTKGENVCSLKTDKKSFLNYPAGTRIRFHRNGAVATYTFGKIIKDSDGWSELRFEVSGKNLRPGTQFIKPLYYLNNIGHDKVSTSYIDDIKFGVQ